MKRITRLIAILIFLVIYTSCNSLKEQSEESQRWSEKKVWRWYKKTGVIVGCNYLPRTATNTTEMFQKETFTPEIIDEELGWARETGYNSVRVFLQYILWKENPEGYISILDQFLDIASSHNIRTMFVFFDDCAFGYPPSKDPYLGPQGDPEPGEYSPYWTPSPGHSLIDDKLAWPDLENYVKNITKRFKDDKRVLVWDMYNEPGNSGAGLRSDELVEKTFKWVREVGPSQPLTLGSYSNDFAGKVSRKYMELSDVISFHAYDDPGGLKSKINICNEYNRPVICTECLIRRNGNTFENFLPIFAENNIGWYNWGLVAGRTQTYMHWTSKKGDPVPEIWQHDIFHPDGKPYIPEEIELIKNYKFTNRKVVFKKLDDADIKWKFTTSIPAYGWHLEDYNDSLWNEGYAGFGTKETPFTSVRTEWKGNNIWLRKTFNLKKTNFHGMRLSIHHDEHAEIYINGYLAAKVEGFNTGKEIFEISNMAFVTLRKGQNVIAVHCHQTSGGQYIDVDIVDLVSSKKRTRVVEEIVKSEIDTGKPWSVEKAQNWYKNISPVKGFNYLPRTAVNTIEMWGKDTFDPLIIDEELAWASKAGYNSMRVFLQFSIWKNDHDGFMDRLEKFLLIADKNNITTMPVFFDDCCFAMKLEPIFGPQDLPVKGIINSGWVPSPGYSMVQDFSQWNELERYVKEIVRTYKNDKRIIVWDMYNEPGPFFDKTLSFPLAKAAFMWTRQINPIQPLTVAVWGNPESVQFIKISDVISLHHYSSSGLVEFFSEQKEKNGRPVMVTECLTRPGPGEFKHILPIFAKHNVGWYNWGLVAGKTQTYYSWNSKVGDPMPEIWMCDVLWPDGKPYDIEEIKMIQNFSF